MKASPLAPDLDDERRGLLQEEAETFFWSRPSITRRGRFLEGLVVWLALAALVAAAALIAAA